MTSPSRKAFESTLLKAEVDPANGDLGIVQAIRSVTANVDHQGDRIIPGAFGKFIAACKSGEARWPAQVLNHQVEPLVITGKVRDMVELMPGDSRLPAKLLAKGCGGLLVTTQYNLATQAGRETFSNVKGGFLEESSFMFWPSSVTAVTDPSQRVSADHLQDIKEIFPIIECSDVLVGANPLTTTITVKSQLTVSSDLARVSELIEKVEVDLRPYWMMPEYTKANLSADDRAFLAGIADRLGACLDMVRGFGQVEGGKSLEGNPYQEQSDAAKRAELAQLEAELYAQDALRYPGAGVVAPIGGWNGRLPGGRPW